jgi:hypothetical protein
MLSMSDTLSVLWNDFGPDRTKEVGSTAVPKGTTLPLASSASVLG